LPIAHAGGVGAREASAPCRPNALLAMHHTSCTYYLLSVRGKCVVETVEWFGRRKRGEAHPA